jgi:HAD superfamily hydrolase (TIGR01484 family)
LNSPALPPFVQMSDLKGIVGLFTDVDDTLTRDGKLSPETFATLWQLRAAGLPVVPVTGRSYGWAHMMLAQWPIDAVIAESGGLYLTRKGSEHKDSETLASSGTRAHSTLKTVFFDDSDKVRRDRARLMDVCAEVLLRYPQLRFASDNVLRQVDVAIDYCEDIPRVSMTLVNEVIQILRQAGFQARNSTVHINAWCGDFDKGPMALKYLKEDFAVSTEEAQKHWAFIGDAPNDRSMFALFPKSIAVANIVPFLSDWHQDRPTWRTQASHGEGFVETAQLLLKLKKSKDL